MNDLRTARTSPLIMIRALLLLSLLLSLSLIFSRRDWRYRA